jgi:hypothetical protein
MDHHTEQIVVILSLAGGLLFPAVWQSFLFRGEGQRLANYLLLLAGSLVMLGVLTALADSMNSGTFIWVFAWNPLAFIAMLEERSTSRDVILAGAIVVDLVLFLILLIRIGIGIKQSGAAIGEASDTLETEA